LGVCSPSRARHPLAREGFFLSLVRVPRSELRLSKVRDAFFPPFALFLFLNFKDKGITQQAVRKTEKFF
jgi:hypothetical protein